MADTTTVKADVASVAYSMALNIWRESGKEEPKLGDETFLQLVSTCALALKGNYGSLDYRSLR